MTWLIAKTPNIIQDKSFVFLRRNQIKGTSSMARTEDADEITNVEVAYVPWPETTCRRPDTVP